MIGHVDMDMLRSSLFPLTNLADENVVLLRPWNETNGHWIITSSDGRIVNLTAIIGGFAAAKNFRIAFQATSDDSYGARFLHFYKFSDFDKDITVLSSIYNSTLSKMEKRTGVLLIRPVVRAGHLKLKTQLPLVRILNNNNNEILSIIPPIDKYLDFKMIFKSHGMLRSLFPYFNKEDLDLFYQYEAAYKMLQPSARVVSIPRNGSFYMKTRDKDSKNELVELSQYTRFSAFTTNLYFRPQPEYFGLAWLTLNIGIPQQDENVLSLTMRIEIVHKPIASEQSIEFPPIAYNLSRDANDGFLVSSLNKYASDIETRVLGIMIYGMSQSMHGKWYYKLKGDNWARITNIGIQSVSDGIPNIHIVRLKPDDAVKFELENDKTFWSYAMAKAWVKLLFKFWDMSDNKNHGKRNFLCIFSLHFNVKSLITICAAARVMILLSQLQYGSSVHRTIISVKRIELMFLFSYCKA